MRTIAGNLSAHLTTIPSAQLSQSARWPGPQPDSMRLHRRTLPPRWADGRFPGIARAMMQQVATKVVAQHRSGKLTVSPLNDAVAKIFSKQYGFEAIEADSDDEEYGDDEMLLKPDASSLWKKDASVMSNSNAVLPGPVMRDLARGPSSPRSRTINSSGRSTRENIGRCGISRIDNRA